MTSTWESDTPEEPYLFRFVESGMQLNYEFESLGEIRTILNHRIEFCPVLTVRGWSDHKEHLASLRVKHFADQNREVGCCLVNQDEVAAWSRLLRQTQSGQCDSEMPISHFEYATRHGIRLVLQPRLNSIGQSCLLYVASMQAAILPLDFADQLLEIFDEFKVFCSQHK